MDPETHPAAPIGRLAPSPTGALHVGNARSLLLAWLSIRQSGGQLWLRIEDIDSPRVKPWAIQQTLEDLRWLGLDWDAVPSIQATAAAASPPPDLRGIVVQTDRMPRYRQALGQLVSRGAAYPCTCSRSDIAAAASAPHESPGVPPLDGVLYPGTCRRRTSPPSEDQPFAWRFRVREGETVAWTDGVFGPQSARVDLQLGDFVIAKRDAAPAYQLAVVVDDHDTGVTEIVRGADLIPSTFRQILLSRQLGWSLPQYYHVPLIVGPDGRRLAKRHGDTRIATLRHFGVTAPALVGYLAWTLNLVPDRAPRTPQSLIGTLDWTRIPHQPTVFELGQELPELLRASRD